MHAQPRLSVVIPVFNEEATLEALLATVESAGLPLLEIIVVDDASTDATPEILRRACTASHYKVFHHEHNQGKGAALRTGLWEASGEIVAIQDADLEYDPKELHRLIQPIVQGRADVVYGSRFSGEGPHRVVYFWHLVGNRFLTLLSNMLTNINLTDMETCYKVFRREILEEFTLEENRFGFEPEVTAKVAALRCRIFEVGISYFGRTYEEGKKIGWRDGFRAMYAIFKYNLFSSQVRRLRRNRNSWIKKVQD